MKTTNRLLRLCLIAGWLVVICILAVPGLGPAQFSSPTVNGTTAAGEYGIHTNGQNQETSGSQTWYMTWDANNLYVGSTGAKLEKVHNLS